MGGRATPARFLFQQTPAAWQAFHIYISLMLLL